MKTIKLNILCTIIGLLSTTSATAEPMSEIEIRARRNTISRVPVRERDDDLELLYPAHNLTVPIDHFRNSSRYEPHSDGTFNLRYFFDATHYLPGGPVIVLQGGETSITDRLPFLQKGLLAQLAEATHGIGVILEHRYYGTSFPTPDLSTENLRFLTTEQALADEVFFAQNVVFKGLEDKDLTSDSVAYIGYGGSYAGAFNAFLRKLYPDIFWGTISSSGVTEAILDYWQYWEPIRLYGPPSCITYTQKLTHVVDNILIGINETSTTSELKAVFGLPNVTFDNDFASVLASGVVGWQGRNWDPAVNEPTFDYYCGNLTADSILYPSILNLTSRVEELLTKGGYKDEIGTLRTPMLNYIGWLEAHTISRCRRQNKSQNQCFSAHNETFYAQDDITQQWRSWPYQFCTEWGYLATGSGAPASQLPIVSRTIDMDYESLICKGAFNITTPPSVDLINKYGGFDLSYPRLAFIDGEQDPWRPATPHASPFVHGVRNRTSTVSEPFILIEGAVHHWDENGLFANETRDGPALPETIRDVQAQEISFVLEWMFEWEWEREMLARGKGKGEDEVREDL